MLTMQVPKVVLARSAEILSLLMLSVFGIYLTFFFTALMVEVEEPHYPPPPFNLSLYNGIKSYRLPRWFVSFLLTHPVARDFLDWAMFTAHAEEHAVPTLARISRTHLLNNGTWQVTQNREVQVIIDMTWSQHKDQSTDHPTTIGLDPRSRSNSMLGRKIQPAGIS